MDPLALNLESKLLVATPAMGDPRFRQAVIYMCAHDDSGAMGIVLNRPKTVPGGEALHLTDLLEQIGVDGIPRVADMPVLEGGPVDIDRGFVLHTADYEGAEGTMDVGEGLAMTSTREVLDALVTDKAPSQAVLAIGYAGWNGGQIEREIADNAWIVCDPDSRERLTAMVFDPNADRKWANALGEIGIDPAMLSAMGGSA